MEMERQRLAHKGAAEREKNWEIHNIQSLRLSDSDIYTLEWANNGLTKKKLHLN